LVEVLTSPRLTVSTDRLLHPVPTLSYEDESIASGKTEVENAKWIKEFRRRFSSIKSKWSRAFCDMEANHLLVVKDLQVLQSSATSFASQLGTPTEDFTPGATIWSVLSGFAKTTAAHGAALVVASESTQDLRQSLTELAESHEAAQAQITSKLQLLERLSHVFESRFNKILPLIVSLKGQPPTVSNKPGDDLIALQNQVQHLAATVDSLKAPCGTQVISQGVPMLLIRARTYPRLQYRSCRHSLKLFNIRLLAVGCGSAPKFFNLLM
jgi:hypothetical protein